MGDGLLKPALCVCHGLPAYWQKDSRMKAGGRWECPVKRQAYNRRRAGNQELLARKREAWHAPGGGYVQRRRQELAGQRARIVERLEQLAKEAGSC